MSNSFNPDHNDETVSDTVDDPLQIPYEQLSEVALTGVLEEYITREGTDYGMIERGVESQLDKARALLKSGKVIIVFDEVHERCQIVEARLLQNPISKTPVINGTEESNEGE